jgi:hypothetical protein
VENTRGGEGGDAVSDDPVRERLVRAVESNIIRVNEAIGAHVKAEADFMSARLDWQASVMALRDYDARQPRCGVNPWNEAMDTGPK